jgi:L-iditol 2-dehydrogenase
MKACVFREPGHLEVVELPTPDPGPGEVLLRVGAAPLCASDLRVFRGEKEARHGVVLGHEIAGEVVAVGSTVSDVRKGQRVAVYPVMPCNACYFCQRGIRNRCLRRVTLGYDENGALAEYLLVPERIVGAGHVFPLSNDLPWELAAMAEPVACTLNSLETCQIHAGSSLLILGGGPMGLKHLILGQALGAATTIVVEPREERQTVARRLGATAVLPPNGAALRDAVFDLTQGRGVDAAVITIGDPEPSAAALPLVRRQGWVNLFAGAPPGAALTFEMNVVHYNELFLTGTQNATPDHFARTVALLPHLPALQQLVTHRFPLDQAPDAFASRMAYEGLKAVVFPNGMN